LEIDVEPKPRVWECGRGREMEGGEVIEEEGTKTSTFWEEIGKQLVGLSGEWRSAGDRKSGARAN